MPFDGSFQGDPTFGYLDLDSVRGYGDRPVEGIYGGPRNVFVRAFTRSWKTSVHLIHHCLYPGDARGGTLRGNLLPVALNMPGQRDDAVLGGHADLSRIHAGFPVEL